MSYQPWVGKLPEGEEVLVSVYWDEDSAIESIEVAFRGEWDRCWGPPVTLERAP